MVVKIEEREMVFLSARVPDCASPKRSSRKGDRRSPISTPPTTFGPRNPRIPRITGLSLHKYPAELPRALSSDSVQDSRIFSPLDGSRQAISCVRSPLRSHRPQPADRDVGPTRPFCAARDAAQAISSAPERKQCQLRCFVADAFAAGCDRCAVPRDHDPPGLSPRQSRRRSQGHA